MVENTYGIGRDDCASKINKEKRVGVKRIDLGD